ncbi:hypothetical protein JJV70_02095 [Streptomyces sp. JJ66]|uniref:hypothetical protein n=1 Tax=Streptomyces sp. JJ66 TaxID=2803843 RepID=UPI001C566ECA|nr:hypothetical protein [Streptomyces sp. JJ66]MBW1600912.1 hypothetical protein [Streptomyces sp. JJ66]
MDEPRERPVRPRPAGVPGDEGVLAELGGGKPSPSPGRRPSRPSAPAVPARPAAEASAGARHSLAATHWEMLADTLTARGMVLAPRDEAALDTLAGLDTTTVGTVVRWLRIRPAPPPDTEPGLRPRLR